VRKCVVTETVHTRRPFSAQPPCAEGEEIPGVWKYGFNLSWFRNKLWINSAKTSVQSSARNGYGEHKEGQGPFLDSGSTGPPNSACSEGRLTS